MQKNPSSHSTVYLIYVLILLLMIGGLLAWQAWKRSEDFDRFHRQLAATSVRGAADEIGLLFAELRRSMEVFTFDRQPLLETILNEPENEPLWVQLEMAVQEHFPEVFGLTLTDTLGEVLRPDFENRVAEVCQQDIRQFIGRGYREQGVIHPNPLGYHFDIMVPWGQPDTPNGVFFLSFHPAMLARILQRLQSPDHELVLLNRSRPGLIEVTARGSRDTLQREFFLDTGELERIGASTHITDSRWDLVDLPDDGLLYKERVRNWLYAGIVFSVFVSVTLLMYYQLRRKENFRAEAEKRATLHQSELAHVDRLNILGQMASGIAHELNQPLSAISTYCQSGLRIIETLENKPEKLVHILESSSQQAKRAGEIIHRIREFASKGKVQPRARDINRLIKEASAFIRPELERQHVGLQLDLGRYLPDVMADSIQIEQVLLNLLANAIEAMADERIGARKLTVSSRLVEEDQIEVRVSDMGHGLDTTARDRIFDTFYTTKTGGMGVGLAISRSIIEAHGGQLQAETNPGPGTTFSFRLPVNRNG